MGGKVHIEGFGDVKIVKHARYVGVTIGANDTYHIADTTRRIEACNAAMSRLAKIWRTDAVSLEKEVHLFKSLVYSILTYALEIIDLPLSQMQRLEALQTRHFRRIGQSVAHMERENNMDLRTRLDIPSLSSNMLYRRLKWWKTLLLSPDLVSVRTAIFGQFRDEVHPPSPNDCPRIASLQKDLGSLVASLIQAGVEIVALPRNHRNDIVVNRITLSWLSQVTKAQMKHVISYQSTAERSTNVKYGPLPEATFECDECGKFFASHARLQTHKSSTHKVREPWRNLVTDEGCPLCGQIFANKRGAQLHVQRVCRYKFPDALNNPPPRPPRGSVLSQLTQ